ncbi:MAG: Trk system potassium transporter TrkA [Gammaproteobacteria bacterium]|nr:Trk system potassium transporter TrkA [Gammaproteobacteria bacterium]
MKIIILGAGQVGGALAESLSSEKMDITVVDNAPDRLQQLQDKLDIRTLYGHASHPEILHQAGIEDADILVAVTGSDELNMMACQIAHTLYHTPTKICRVRSPSYAQRSDLFHNEAIPVDVLISPEQLVTDHIIGLLDYPGALQVLNFADDLVRLVAIRAQAGDKFIGETLYDIRKMTPKQDARVAAIFRGDRAIKPQRTTEIEPLDEVFYIAATENIRPVMQELGQLSRPYNRLMIAGGGNIGMRLAKAIEGKHSVKLIEKEEQRANLLAEQLGKTIVLRGSASDKELLISENIDAIDVFIALTNDDEANIMSSLLAKKLGARKVITLIANPAYVDLVQGGDIDIAFAPQQITIGSLLTHVRRGDMAAVHSLRRGAAEALEIVAHGDAKTSKVVGRRIDELHLPEDVRVGALVRDNKVIVAHQNVVVEPEDHIVIFLADKKQIPAVEALFQVGIGFFG